MPSLSNPVKRKAHRRVKIATRCVICKTWYYKLVHCVRRQESCGRSRCKHWYNRQYSSRRRVKSFTEEDLAILRAHWFPAPRTKATYYLSAVAGLRVTEVTAVNIEDVLGERGEAQPAFRIGGLQTKTGESGTVLVGHEGARAIQDYIGDRRQGPLIVAEKGRTKGGRMNRRSLQAWVEKLNPLFSEHHSFHDLRHTAGHRAARIGGLQLAQEVLRHKTPACTTIYIQRRVEETLELLFGKPVQSS